MNSNVLYSSRVLCLPHAQESHIGQTVVPVQTNGAITIGTNGTTDHKTSKTNTDDDRTRKQVSKLTIACLVLVFIELNLFAFLAKSGAMKDTRSISSSKMRLHHNMIAFKSICSSVELNL